MATMSWVDKVAHKMRQIYKLRDEYGDQFSPVDELHRPDGMKNAHSRRKRNRLKRLEGEVEQLLTLNFGKHIDKRKKQYAAKSTTDTR